MLFGLGTPFLIITHVLYIINQFIINWYRPNVSKIMWTIVKIWALDFRLITATRIIERERHPNQDWACFFIFFYNLRIINIVLKNGMIILKQIVWDSKKGIKILVGQTVLKLLIKTVFFNEDFWFLKVMWYVFSYISVTVTPSGEVIREEPEVSEDAVELPSGLDDATHATTTSDTSPLIEAENSDILQRYEDVV